MSCFSCD